jgi:hypothetical protein
LGVSPGSATLPQLAAPYQPVQTPKTAKPNVFRPIAKGRQVGGQANARRDQDSQALAGMEQAGERMGEAMGQAMGKMMSAMTQAIGGALQELDAQMGPYPGKSGEMWMTQGTVAWAHTSNGQAMVLLKRPAKDGWTDHFLFRGDHESLQRVVEGMKGRAAGKYSGKDVDQKNKVTNYILDEARFITDDEWNALQAGGNAADRPGGEATEETKKSFNAATKGWAFKGTVDGEDGRTVAVFEKPGEGGEKEAEVKLVRSGQLVEPGFRVLWTRAGQAEVRVEGRTFGVTPW